MANAVGSLTGHAPLQMGICRIWYFYVGVQFLLCAFAGIPIVTGEVLECQLLATQVCLCVISTNYYTAVDTFAKGIFQPILHIQSWNVFQQEELIMMKEAFGSIALALRPGPCLGWRGNAVTVSHLPRHSLWTGQELPATSVFPSRYRRGPKT